MHRFFVPGELLRSEQVRLPDAAARHASRVLRLASGSEVLLLDGTGACALVRLERVARDQVAGRVLRRWMERETALPVRLLQGLPKGDKLDLVLQKGTELGVTLFAPVRTGRTLVRREGREAQERWERIIAEAARQSRRPVLPGLLAPEPLADALARVTESLRLLLWEEATQPLAEVLPPEPPADAALLIGPEGGLSADEARLARAAGFLPVHLGPRVLRTETAGLALVTLLQARYGDLAVAPAPANRGG